MRDQAGSSSGDFPHELHSNTTRQDVGLDFVLARKLLHARRPDPMTTNDFLDHTFVRKAVNTAFVSVANTERMENGQVIGNARGKKLLLDFLVKQSGFHEPATATNQADRIAIIDEVRDLIFADEFVLFHE